MQKKIVTTTAAGGLGLPAGHKLLKVASGQYTGRQVAIMQTTSGDIVYSYADRPYSSWSTPVTIASDSADEPFDAVMSAIGDIHVVYSEVTTQYLVTHKLVFSGGVWSVASKVTIYNGDVSLYPSIGI
jgi:hypothetical protein